MLRAYLIELNIRMSSQTAASVKVFDKDVKEDISTLTRVREIVLSCGWNSTSYQIINPGIRHWFSGAKKAVVGFVSQNGVRVVAGAPICEKNDLRETAAEFEKDAARMKERVCYFCAERRLESICAESKNYAKVLLGAQPVWHPKSWAGIIETHKSLRAQLNRARNKNVKVEEWSGEKARNHPALEKCLHDWLANKGLPPLAFLVEPDTLSHLEDRRIFVAMRESKVVGFVLLSPVTQRSGWLFEQFIHCPNAPNGTVELMIDTAMRVLAKDGYEYATLGLAPLSTRAEIPQFENPLWLHILLFWMRKHAGRFYNFDGLDAFKAKLQPERWEPVFAISNEKSFSFRTLYAIASAFSGGAPVRLFLGGIWRAVLTEINWLKQKLNKLFSN
jgi:phosphatidylglycerol lysyltransferase